MKEMLTPVTDAKGTSAYLILNPAAGSAATLLRSLTKLLTEGCFDLVNGVPAH